MRAKSKPRNLGGRPPVPDAEKRRRGTLRSYNTAHARARRRGNYEFQPPPAPQWFTPEMRQAYLEGFERSIAARPVESKAEARKRGMGLLKWAKFDSPPGFIAPSSQEFAMCGYEPEEWEAWCEMQNRPTPLA